MNEAKLPAERRLLRRKQVLEMAGISNTTLHRLINQGAFPRPVAIGVRSVAWWSDEVQATLSALPRASGASPNPSTRKAA